MLMVMRVEDQPQGTKSRARKGSESLFTEPSGREIEVTLSLRWSSGELGDFSKHNDETRKYFPSD